VLFSELSSAAITSLMSLFFHGKVTHDYLITSGVVALLVSFLLAFILIRLIDAVRKAEKKSEEERDRTIRYFDRAGFVFLIIGVDQNVIAVNEKGAEILGYSRKEIEGRNWFDHFIPERQREEVREVFRKALSGEAASVEFNENFVLTKSGAEKLIAWHNAVLKDEQGAVTGTLSSGEDVTEQEKWEESLQEQKKFAEKLIENSAVATFVVNPDHKVVLWNKACEELTGVPASAMIGTRDQWRPFYADKRQSLADVIIDGNLEDLPRLYGAYSRSVLIANGLQTQGWYKNLNGRDRYVIFDAAPIYDSKGRLAVVIETLQDITTQKRMEDALVENEARLKTIINTEPECVKLTAADGTILEMNPAGLAMIEADSPGQIVGKSMLPLISAEHRSAVLAHSERVFNGEPGTIEFEIVGMKGNRRWLETRAAPLKNAQGEIYAILGVTRDITERKQWVEKLQEQLRFLQLLIDTIPMPVFYKDAQGVYQGCNKAFTDFLGQTKVQIIGKSVYDMAPRELADKYHNMDRELFEHPGIQVYEHSVKHADGTRHDVIFNKATYLDAQGTVAGLLGVMQDITDRKKTEQLIQRNYDVQTAINWILNISLKDVPLDGVLKQSLDLMLSIPWLSFEARGSIFLVEGDPGRLVMKAERGLSDHIRQNCAIVPFGTCLCGRAAATGEVQFADGLDDRHEVHYEGMAPHGHYCVPIKSGRTVLGVINIYINAGHPRDLKEIEFLNAVASALAGIIQRKRIEGEREKLIGDLRTVLDTVSRSQKEWRDTFDSITDMISIVSKDFTILKANKAFSAYYGFQPSEVINRQCFELTHEGGSPVPNCPHRITVEEGRMVSEEIFDKRTNKMFRLSTYPYYSPGGEIIGSIHVARDITEEKEKEMRLIMSERLAALGQMASGIAHEINNPLASIAGCSEGLLSRVKKGQRDDKLFETYLNIIQEEVFRCKSITTAMLSFVRKTTYEKKDVNINEMLDKTLEVISFQGRLKALRVIKKYRDPLPLVHGNEGELRQVFLAIITNALDAMGDKGALTLETGTGEGGAVIGIHDTGPGVPPDILPKIFDPFFTTKSEKGGTGLGLSIARKIILNHSGTIDVDSEPGAGTRFTITLPL
jgi:PAS domain S-box-containing protein